MADRRNCINLQGCIYPGDRACFSRCALSPPDESTNPANLLAAAADTFRERDAIYGRAWVRVGKFMEALFPDGIKLTTAKDHERFSQLIMLAVKQTRYANNFHKGGHRDSIHDAMVYCAILEAIDDDLQRD